jgi:hypothetical protein
MKESDCATGKAEEQTGESIDHGRCEAVIRPAKYTAPAMLAVLLSVDQAGATPGTPARAMCTHKSAFVF